MAKACDPLPQLPLELRAAVLERGEKPETFHDCLQALRALLEDDDLLNPRLDTDFLVRFLRAKRYNVPRAHQQIRKYYRSRKILFPDDEIPAHLRWPFETNILSPLTEYDLEKRPIFHILTNRWIPSTNRPFDDLFKAVFVASEIFARDVFAQVNGLTIILDLDGVGISMASYIPSNSGHYIGQLDGTIPIMTKRLHFLNEGRIFSVLFTAATPFVPKTTLQSIVRHTTTATLRKHIAPEVLYVKYGGKAPLPNGASVWSHLVTHKDTNGMTLEQDYAEFGICDD